MTEEKRNFTGEETDFIDPKGGGKLLSNDNTLFSNESGFVLWKTISGYSLNEDDINNLLSGKETILINDFQKKTGGTFSAKIKLDENFKTKFIFENKDFPSEPTGIIDPNGGEIFENDKTYINKEQDYIIWKNLSNHNISKEELKKLLNGETIGSFNDFYSKRTSKSFEASIKFDKNTKKLEFVF